MSSHDCGKGSGGMSYFIRGVMLMPSLIINAPNEKQKLFLKADVKHIGFGGARGGG